MDSKIYVFYAGDSTAAQKEYRCYPETGIGQMLPLFLKENITVHNHAVNGRSTKSFIDEGRLLRIDKEIRKGDFLLIQFGHNDEKKEDPTRYTEAHGSFKTNLEKFINVARKHEAIPILLTAIERRRFDTEGSLLHTHGEYIEAVRQTADENHCALIDMNELTRKEILSTGEEESRKYFMNFDKGIYDNYPDGKDDNTHLRPEGAMCFAGLLAKALKELGGIYAGLVE